MKYLAIILSILIFFGCESSTDPEQPNHKMYLSPGSVTISVGEQSEITLKIQNIPKSVFAMSLQLNYDNTVLAFSDSIGLFVGDFFDQNAISFVKNNNSKIHLSFTQLKGQNQVNGSGVLCILTFTGKSAGVSMIRILESELHFYNSEGNNLNLSDLEFKTATINVQ